MKTPLYIWDINQVMLIAGRMLYLSQKFELTCKSILPSALTISKGQLENKGGYTSYHEFELAFMKFKDNPLGMLKKKSEGLLNKIIGEIGIIAIDQAIKSRNFVCHELLHEVIFASGKNSALDELRKKNKYVDQEIQICPSKNYEYKDKEKIIFHARNIATGDFYVSKLMHTMETGGSFSINKEKYIESLEGFIRFGFECKIC